MPLISRETRVAKQLQPVVVTLPRQQLRRALPFTLRTLASQETTVIQKELQQGQVVRAQLPPREEIVPQTTIEVLHHAAGTHHQSRHRCHRLTYRVATPPQRLPQRRLTRPTPYVRGRQHLH